MQPTITVILPVYNGAAYLGEAIQSVLDQTCRDFELIIINDGSTDNSENIILSYQDDRIRYIKQENRGLVGSLNRGIAEAKGHYIARMDADDISLPHRLEKQLAWMQEHPDTVVLSTLIDLIDEHGEKKGRWYQDKDYTTPRQIRQVMPYMNCLTHSVIMARKDILLAYPYDPKQVHIEDYDLWLRMLTEGLIIEKYPEVLLLVRVHESSVTMGVKRNNIFFKQFRCKRRYLGKRLARGRFSWFDLHVVAGMLFDYAKGAGKSLKNLK